VHLAEKFLHCMYSWHQVKFEHAVLFLLMKSGVVVVQDNRGDGPGFEFHIAAVVKSCVFWDIILSCSTKVDGCFAGIVCLVLRIIRAKNQHEVSRKVFLVSCLAYSSSLLIEASQLAFRGLFCQVMKTSHLLPERTLCLHHMAADVGCEATLVQVHCPYQDTICRLFATCVVSPHHMSCYLTFALQVSLPNSSLSFYNSKTTPF
jgi:hypothetical protein